MTLRFKRGSTFTATCLYAPDAGAAADLRGAVITSQLRAEGGVVADLAPTLAADGLSFTLDYAQATDAWPVTVASWDIRITLGGAVVYSETVKLSIENNVTRPA